MTLGISIRRLDVKIRKGNGNFNLDFAINVEHLVGQTFLMWLLEMHNTTERSRNSNFTAFLVINHNGG